MSGRQSRVVRPGATAWLDKLGRRAGLLRSGRAGGWGEIMTPYNLRGGPLTSEDRATLARCGISTELAEAAFLRRVDSTEGAQIVGRNGAGEYGGLIFPYIWPGDRSVREYRLRRDRPDLERKADGSLKERARYLSAPGR